MEFCKKYQDWELELSLILSKMAKFSLIRVWYLSNDLGEEL